MPRLLNSWLSLLTAPAVLLWTARSTNTKTGDVPTAWVGPTPEHAETTCTDCPVRSACYAHLGNPKRALGAITRAIAALGRRVGLWRYRLAAALRNRNPRARFARSTSIGDTARLPRRAVLRDFATVRRVGLGLLAYTHFPREAPWLRPHALASVETLDSVDYWRAHGWAAAVILPPGSGPTTTPDGRQVAVCPAERGKLDGRKKITCNDCGLCDATHPVWDQADFGAIGFPAHGPIRTAERYRLHMPELIRN